MEYLHRSATNTLRWLGIWDRIDEPLLSATVSLMRGFGWGVQHVPVPPVLRSSVREMLLGASELLNPDNHPLLHSISDPLGNWIEYLAVLAVDTSDRQDEHNALQLFFKLGLRVGNEPHYGNRLGSGDYADPQNCFFPEELAAGPNPNPIYHSVPMSSTRNARIATSCALVSMLSYRTDDVILHCMINAKPPMLPKMSFCSVHTHEEGDLGVFVAKDFSFAIFCFRGTEYETMRDWLTSVLLNPTSVFGEVEDTDVKVRDRYFKQMLLACQDSHLKNVADGPGPLPHSSMTPSEFVDYLYREHPNIQIYYTGHSLGAGLATLFGAMKRAEAVKKAQEDQRAVICTFGSPPVGNVWFCDWYSLHVPVSWRFVNRDEFAPMAPPLPFTENVVTQELVHVKDDLIKVEDLTAKNPRGMSPIRMDRHITHLQEHNMVSNLILDHNPALSLFSLQAKCSLSS